MAQREERAADIGKEVWPIALAGEDGVAQLDRGPARIDLAGGPILAVHAVVGNRAVEEPDQPAEAHDAAGRLHDAAIPARDRITADGAVDQGERPQEAARCLLRDSSRKVREALNPVAADGAVLDGAASSDAAHARS